MSTAPAARQNAPEFVETLQAAFERACRGSDRIERDFGIGPLSFRLRVANAVLAEQMTRALEHLSLPTVQNPDLTVLLWDDVTTHTQLPPLPWHSLPTRLQFETIQQLNTSRIYLSFNEYGGILNGYDTASNTAFFWLEDGRSVPTHEWSTPLRNILHWFLMRHGAHFIHSGAVGLPSGGVLLAGKGGSGKSTTAVECLNSPLQYAADDYCVVTANPPTVYSLYSSAKLHGDNLARVPHVYPVVANRHELPTEKATVLLQDKWNEKLVLQMPLRAILLPRVCGGRDTTLTPASALDAIRALTMSTISFLPRTDAATVRRLNHLVASLPLFHLCLGTEMAQVPQTISRLLGWLESQTT